MPRAGEPTGPSPWVVRCAHLVPARGAVADLACGAGRHTRLFVDRGHPVTAVDRDLARLGALAGDDAVETIEGDLENPARWPLGTRRFAGVVVTNFLARATCDRVVGAVDRGGVLIWETFAVGNAAFGRPRNPDFLLRPGELLDAVAGALTVVAFEQGRDDAQGPRIVQRVCAVRRAGLATPIPA